MPTVTLTELVKSLEETQSYDGANSVDRVYVAQGSDDPKDVDAAAAAVIQPTYNLLPFQNYRKVPQGGGVWEVTIRYGQKGTEDELTLDTTGGTAKIMTSRSTSTYTPLNANPTDYRRLINVHDGRVDGVDIHVPAFGFTLKRFFSPPGQGGVDEVQTVRLTGGPTGGFFTLTWQGDQTDVINYNAAASDVQIALGLLGTIGPGNVSVSGNSGGPWAVTFTGALGSQPQPLMTATASLIGGSSPGVSVSETTRGQVGDTLPPGYVQLMYDLTGSVNQTPVNVTVRGMSLDFAAGELLFLGATGGYRGNEKLEFVLRFAASQSVTGLTIGSGTNGPVVNVTKLGWEYLWVVYQDTVDNSALVKTPVQVNVEQVYPYADLNPLFA